MENNKINALIFKNEHYYRVEKNDSSSKQNTDFSTKTAKDFVGFYERSPVQNLLHQVDLKSWNRLQPF